MLILNLLKLSKLESNIKIIIWEQNYFILMMTVIEKKVKNFILLKYSNNIQKLVLTNLDKLSNNSKFKFCNIKIFK